MRVAKNSGMVDGEKHVDSSFCDAQLCKMFEMWPVYFHIESKLSLSRSVKYNRRKIDVIRMRIYFS